MTLDLEKMARETLGKVRMQMSIVRESDEIELAHQLLPLLEFARSVQKASEEHKQLFVGFRQDTIYATNILCWCGLPESSELHQADAELLKCSSLTLDDYHKFQARDENIAP